MRLPFAALVERQRARGWGWAIVLLAVALCLPALGGGLVADDLAHRAFTAAGLAGELGTRPWWDMFRLVEGDPVRVAAQRSSGILPWWTVSELEVAFFRPITVLTHYLDALAWPDAPWLMHAHSLAVYGLVCALAFMLLRAVAKDEEEPAANAIARRAGGLAVALAGLVFALDSTHADPAAWIAERNALLATAFGLAAVLAHHRARTQGARLAAVLAPLALAGSLLSAELGVSTLAFLIAHAFALERGRALRRLAGLLPCLAVAAGWAVAYRVAGFGAHGSGAYVDPVRSPLLFATLLPGRLGALVGMQWGAPVRLAWLRRDDPLVFWLAMVLGSVALISIVVFVVARVRGDRRLRFWVLAFAICLLPLAASTPGDRLLLFASVASAAIVAQLLAAWGRSGPGWRRRAAWVVAVVHGPMSAIALVTAVWSHRELASGGSVFTHGAALAGDERLPGQVMVIVNAPTAMHAQMLPVMREAAGLHRPSFTYLLGASDEPVTVTRLDRRSFELSTVSGYLREPFSAFYRGPDAPLSVGERVETLAFTAEVLELGGRGEPRRVRFELARDPEHPSLRFVTWDGRDYVPFELPAVGDSVAVAGFFR